MRKTTFSIAVLAGLLVQSTIAMAEGCSLNQIKLDCGNGNNASILTALASPKTGEALGTPIESIDNFKAPIELEVFRKSIEANWTRANSAERAERRRLKRREISNEEFEEWSKQYDAARTHYDAAMTLYRNLVWFGKNGKPAPAG